MGAMAPQRRVQSPMTADPHAAWLWLGIVLLGTVLLGVAIAYGSAKWRRAPRNRELDQARDEVTRERYREENRPG
jgi:hypothetical protein